MTRVYQLAAMLLGLPFNDRYARLRHLEKTKPLLHERVMQAMMEIRSEEEQAAAELEEERE